MDGRCGAVSRNGSSPLDFGLLGDGAIERTGAPVAEFKGPDFNRFAPKMCRPPGLVVASSSPRSPPVVRGSPPVPNARVRRRIGQIFAMAERSAGPNQRLTKLEKDTHVNCSLPAAAQSSSSGGGVIGNPSVAYQPDKSSATPKSLLLEQGSFCRPEHWPRRRAPGRSQTGGRPRGAAPGWCSTFHRAYTEHWSRETRPHRGVQSSCGGGDGSAYEDRMISRCADRRQCCGVRPRLRTVTPANRLLDH